MVLFDLLAGEVYVQVVEEFPVDVFFAVGDRRILFIFSHVVLGPFRAEFLGFSFFEYLVFLVEVIKYLQHWGFLLGSLGLFLLLQRGGFL